MGEPEWIHITSKKYIFEGVFNPKEIYSSVMTLLNEKLYDVDEEELETNKENGKLQIFTHINAVLEYNRRYYIKLLFSLNLNGTNINDGKDSVDGRLAFYINTYVQQHSLLFEKNPNVVTKFLTKVYDTYIDHDGFENALVHSIIEAGGLIAHLKSKVHRRK